MVIYNFIKFKLKFNYPINTPTIFYTIKLLSECYLYFIKFKLYYIYPINTPNIFYAIKLSSEGY